MSSGHDTRRGLGTSARAIALAVALVLGGAIITALLPWFTGRDPALAVLRARESERAATPELLDDIRVEFDLPESPWESVTRFLSGLIHLDLGNSWVNPSDPALGAAIGGLGISASLVFTSLVVSTLIAVAVVAPRVLRAADGRPSGSAPASVLAALAAMPDFVLAVLLLWVFAIQLGWFPVGGWAGPANMVLPVTALAIAAGGLYGRVLLISADSSAGEAWVEAWRINGVPRGVIARKLMWRSFIPTLPMLSLFFAGTVTGTAAIELTFNIPGFGRTVVSAAQDQDIPVIQAAVMIALVIGAACGLLAHAVRRKLLAPLESGTGSAAAPSSASSGTGAGPGRAWLIAATVPLVLVIAGVYRDAGIVPADRLLGMSAAHPLGTDQLGRDIWARLADGSLYSIGAAVAVTAACAVIAIVLAHSGRWVEQLGDALNALPAVLIGLILAGVFGGSTWTAALAVALTGWIPLAAHGAAVADEARATGHYRYAATMGASRWHLLRRHVLPMTVPAIIRHAFGRVAHNALSLAALGYLGVGAVHDSPEWGVVLQESSKYLERAPWMVLGPTVCLISLGVVASVATDMWAVRKPKNKS